MRFMALIYSDPALEPPYGTPAFETMMKDYGVLRDKMLKSGVFIHGDGLQDIDTAKSVRIRDGKSSIMDGPFADTKERLGGYYIMECKDMEEALRVAAMIPSASSGTIEVRPVADYGL